MLRRSLGLALVVVSIAASPSAGAQEQAPPDAATVEWIDAAAPGVLEEIALLAETGALQPDPVIAFIRDWMEYPFDDRQGLLDDLDFVEELNESVLESLDPVARRSLSEAVVFVMSESPTGVIDRIDNGDTAFLDPGPWILALSDLIVRGGTTVGPRGPADRTVIIDVLQAFDRGEISRFADWVDLQERGQDVPASTVSTTATTTSPASAVAQTTAVAPTTSTPSDEQVLAPEGVVAEAAAAPAAPGGGDSLSLAVIAGAAAAIVLGAVALLVFGLRRRREVAKHPDQDSRQDPGLTDVLDTSRRMTAALDGTEIQHIAIADSVRLSGAEAGAFVTPDPAGAIVSVSTNPDLFAGDVITTGSIRTVMETGQSAQLVTADDPALVRVPAALAAVPVIAAGGVAGAIVVVRAANSPFDPADVAALELLAPVTGTALRAAATHRSAVTAADIDGLTKVPNRRRLDQDLAELGSCSTTGFAMIDVDHFKLFNDQHGHPAGDVALQIVAETIVSNVRVEDTVYRYGGEEFSVLLGACEESEAMAVLERVRTAVASTPIPISDTDDTPQFLTISIGLADAGIDEPGQLARSADAALYSAKKQGRDRVVVTS